MNISPIKFLQNNTMNCSKKGCKKPSAQNTISNNFELPKYNIAFGAQVIDYSKNPLVGLKLEDKEEVALEVDLMLEAARQGDQKTLDEKMGKLFAKYSGRRQVHRYIISKGINTKNMQDNKVEPNYLYMKAYFDYLDTYFKNDRAKKRNYLIDAIFMKNEAANNLVHASIGRGGFAGNGIIPLVFDVTEEFPTLQAKILESRNFQGRTIGDRILFSTSNDYKKCNEILYKLCTKTKSINRAASINLLKINMNMLNDDNREALEALMSKDCICYGELSKANKQNSYTSLTSDDFKKLDKMAEQIIVHGGTLTKGVVLTDVPIVELKYMCLCNKESYMDVNKVDLLKLCRVFGKALDSDSLEKLYTAPDFKGRLLSSSLCKSERGLKMMNEACSKRGAKVLYKIYMHKDDEGKTMADYMLTSDEKLTQGVIDEVNNTLINICNSGLPLKDLKALKDTYIDFLDERMQKIADEIETRIRQPKTEVA